MATDLRAPAADQLLAAWEHGLVSASARAGLLLAALGVADPDRLPLGARNRQLLGARILLFGTVADVVARCEECGEELEADVHLPDLLDALPDAPVTTATPIRVSSGGYHVTVRVPTAVDLHGLPGDVEAAAWELTARCVGEARLDDTIVQPRDLPVEVCAAIDDALAAADPGAVLDLTLACPSCGATTTRSLDPVALLWSELDTWAWKLLTDVHLLAAAHGWSEADVLAMSPARRQAYLHLCGVGT